MKKRALIFLMFGTLALQSCSKPAAPPDSQAAPGTATPGLSEEVPGPTETPTTREYVIEDLKGTVLIFEEGSTQGEKAEVEQIVGSGDEIITKSDSSLTLSLDEDTFLQIPANSDLKVDLLKPNSSTGFLSRLKLVEGRVLCEVEKLQETRSSFEVTSGGVICGVRGTAFEVQKEGQSVHTNTFHGIVEMKKGDKVMKVAANQHLDFSITKNGFTPIRTLKPKERDHYRTWSNQKKIVLKKQSQRLAVLRSIENLPPEERAQVLQDTSKAKPKDRVKKMRQLLQRTYVPEPNGPSKTKPRGPKGALPIKGRQRPGQERAKTGFQSAVVKRSNRANYEKAQRQRGTLKHPQEVPKQTTRAKKVGPSSIYSRPPQAKQQKGSMVPRSTAKKIPPPSQQKPPVKKPVKPINGKDPKKHPTNKKSEKE